jgi:hypothetical protein
VTTKKTTAKPRARKAKAVTTSEAIKGFNHDMTCLGFQFEIGKEYSVPGKVVPCKNGFHACPVDTVDPMRVFGFYPPGKSRYCIVDQGGEIVPHGDDKAASGTIFIRKEISISAIIDRAVAYRLKNTKATGGTSNSGGYSGAASNSGTRGAASNSGGYGAASNSGGYGAASNSGYSGAASNSGTRGAASNSGDSGAASNSGNYGAASNSYGAASNSGGYGAASNSGYSGAASNSGDYGAASNSGGYGAASNSGTRGAASNSGGYGAASNSGNSGAASNSGDYGAASNSGDYGAASNSGNYGAAFSHACNSKVLCEGDGQALYITEFADDGSIASVACGVTGRDGIKAGIWYVCKGGKLVPAEKSA